MAGGALGVVLVLIALITALVPPLGLLGCCACLLPIGAGLFAANQYIGKSPVPVQIGDGALLGAIAGAVGGLINLIIGVPISYVINSAAMAAQMDQLRNAGIALPMVGGFAIAMVGGIIGIVVDAVLGVIGGLIGVAAFEKRKGGAGAPPPPPPPASGYGGGPGAPGAPGGGYGQGM